MMNNGHYVSYPSSVGYADTFPPRGRLENSLASIKTVGDACPYKRLIKKASPREKLARNATDEGSREAAWNKRYRKAERKDLIRC